MMAQERANDAEAELALFEQLGYHGMLVHLGNIYLLAFANRTCTCKGNSSQNRKRTGLLNDASVLQFQVPREHHPIGASQ